MQQWTTCSLKNQNIENATLNVYQLKQGLHLSLNVNTTLKNDFNGFIKQNYEIKNKIFFRGSKSHTTRKLKGYTNRWKSSKFIKYLYQLGNRCTANTLNTTKTVKHTAGSTNDNRCVSLRLSKSNTEHPCTHFLTNANECII